MASGDDSKKDEGEDLFSQIEGYKPFSSPQHNQSQPQPGQTGQPDQNLQPNQNPLPNQQHPATNPQNPWFTNQQQPPQPAYPVSPGFVGPAEPIGPTGIDLPKLRPQDDPNSSEYIPRTPVLNAPAPDPSSPWTPVPEPKWEFFAEEQKLPPQPQAQPEARRQVPAGGSQANPLPFNSLPIVTGVNAPVEEPLEPSWPGSQSNNLQQFQNQPQAQPLTAEQQQFLQQQQMVLKQFEQQQLAQQQHFAQQQQLAQQQFQQHQQQTSQPGPVWPTSNSFFDQPQTGQNSGTAYSAQPTTPQVDVSGSQYVQPNVNPNVQPQQYNQQQHFNQQQQFNQQQYIQQQQQQAQPDPQAPDHPWPNASVRGGRQQSQAFENASQQQMPLRSRSKLLGGEQETPPPSIGLSFSKHDILGVATYNLNVTREILMNPLQYFQNLPLTGGYGEPLLYTVFTCIISAIMVALGKMNPLMFFWALIVGFISVTLGSVIVDQAFRKLGGKGDLEGTFRVIAYSKATFVISWIALGPLALGMMLATLITGYMNYIGLMRVQKLSPRSTLIIVAVLSILGLVFKWSCPGV